MIKLVTIGNFQAFATPMDFQLSKLNLLYGANSNGKSSFFRAIKLLAENVEDSLSKSDGEWSFNGQGLTLQSFANTVNQNDETKDIHFGISFTLRCISARYRKNPDIPEIRREIFKLKKQMRDLTLFPEQRRELSEKLKKISLKMDKVRQDNTFDLPLSLELGLSSPGQLSSINFIVDEFKNPDTNDLSPSVSLKFKRVQVGESLEWEFSDSKKKYGDIARFQEVVSYLNDALTFTGVQSADTRSYVNADLSHVGPETRRDPQFDNQALEASYVVFGNGGGIEISGGESDLVPPEFEPNYAIVNRFIELIWKSFSREIKNIDYVGPLREIPQLALAKESWFNELKHPDKHGITILGRRFLKAKTWFEKLTDGQYGFEFSELTIQGKPSGYSALQVTSGNFKTNLQNVGVGISQVLPVVFSLFGATSSSRQSRILLIEQPELHLHPKLQSELADAIIASTKELPERQIFIETHSENLLLRILRRMREHHLGRANPKSYLANKDVSLLFIERKKSGALVSKLEISTSGEMLDPWPLDFVDIRLDDVL